MGVVEVDETFFGGPEPGRRGRGALGKTLVAVAAEQRGRGIGRCRMQIIEDAKAGTLREFLLDHVVPGEIVITDGWASYARACEGQYEHRPEPVAPSELQAHAGLSTSNPADARVDTRVRILTSRANPHHDSRSRPYKQRMCAHQLRKSDGAWCGGSTAS